MKKNLIFLLTPYLKNGNIRESPQDIADTKLIKQDLENWIAQMKKTKKTQFFWRVDLKRFKKTLQRKK